MGADLGGVGEVGDKSKFILYMYELLKKLIKYIKSHFSRSGWLGQQLWTVYVFLFFQEVQISRNELMPDYRRISGDSIKASIPQELVK